MSISVLPSQPYVLPWTFHEWKGKQCKSASKYLTKIARLYIQSLFLIPRFHFVWNIKPYLLFPYAAQRQIPFWLRNIPSIERSDVKTWLHTGLYQELLCESELILMQRSVTVLSLLPFPELFCELSSRIARRVSTAGASALLEACDSIAKW